MNSFKIFSAGSLLILSTMLVLTACEKTFDNKISSVPNLANKSQVQVFIATVNASRNVIMVDGKRVCRPTLTSGTSFPVAVYPSTNAGTFFAIDGGLRAFQILDTLSTTKQIPLAFSANMEVNKMYSIFAYDTITSPKQVTVETEIVIPTDNSARIRFANFVHDANAVPAVDIFSKRRNETIFSNINRTEVTSFISTPSLINDTLIVRQAGTTTALATFNSFNPTQNRSYTLLFSGSYRGTRAINVFGNY